MAKNYIFQLPGITCNSCVTSVERTIRNLSKSSDLNISYYKASFVTKRLTLVINNHDLSDKQVINTIEPAMDNIGIECQFSETTVDEAQRIHKHIIKAILGLLAGVGVMLLSIFGFGLPMLIHYLIIGLGSLLTFYLGAQIYLDAYKKLFKAKALTMDTLFAISTLAAIAVSIASLFVPGLPMMIDAALLIFGFRHLGKAIEEKAKQKILLAVNFRTRAPRRVKVIKNGNIEEKDIGDVEVDEIILVKPGEIIPLDGEIQTEDAVLYKTIITGSTTPYKMAANQKVLAGMQATNDSAEITLKVTKTELHSYLALLDVKIEQSQTEEAPIEAFANQVLQWFIPSILLLALIAGIVISVLFSPATAIQCVIALLVSACPCTFGFIVPFAMMIGINKAVNYGIRFKSANALESANSIEIVFCDLNGTLTVGSPQVTSVMVSKPTEFSENKLLQYFYAIERHSTHAIAHAIVKHAQSQQAVTDLIVDNIDTKNHNGIRATIDSEPIIIGNKTMMQECGIDLQDYQYLLTRESTQQIIFLACNSTIVGYVILQDPLRRNAASIIETLRDQGKQIYICTGADETVAIQYAKQLGIAADHVFANCQPISPDEGKNDTINPKSKVDHIARFQTQKRKVCMIGDAGNDAVAIAKADLGIAIKSDAGDEITQQNAGVVIHNQNLTSILTTFYIAKSAMQICWQNIIMSLSYNMIIVLIAGGLLLAAGFIMNPGLGVALMILQTCLILFNTYRLNQQALPKNLTAEGPDNTDDPSNGNGLSNNTQLHRTLGQASVPVPVNTTDQNFKSSHTQVPGFEIRPASPLTTNQVIRHEPTAVVPVLVPSVAVKCQ